MGYDNYLVLSSNQVLRKRPKMHFNASVARVEEITNQGHSKAIVP
jgi:hypothetical protein